MTQPTTHDRRSTSGILFIRGLPKTLKDHYKAWCAKRGLTMTQHIEQLIRKTVKEGDTNEV